MTPYQFVDETLTKTPPKHVQESSEGLMTAVELVQKIGSEKERKKAEALLLSLCCQWGFPKIRGTFKGVDRGYIGFI